MKKLFGVLSAAVLVTGLNLMADDAKTDLKKAGSDVKTAGKETGDAAKNAGKGVAKGVKKGVNKAAGATEHGAAKVKAKTTDTK